MKEKVFPRVIAYLVEKSVKGIKKQLHGYVQKIQWSIAAERDYMEAYIQEFKRVIEKSRRERQDFAAFDLMLDEGKRQAKMMLEMREMLNIINNRMFDLEQLSIQVKQQLIMQGMKIKS